MSVAQPQRQSPNTGNTKEQSPVVIESPSKNEETIVPTEENEKRLRREAKRVHVMQEILSTEKTYGKCAFRFYSQIAVKTLNILISHYIRPITRAQILSKETHEKIFNEIELVFQINGKNLVCSKFTLKLENFLKELENIMSINSASGFFNNEESVTGFRVNPSASQLSQLASLLLFYVCA
jgi:hypothetical protein